MLGVHSGPKGIWGHLQWPGTTTLGQKGTAAENKGHVPLRMKGLGRPATQSCNNLQVFLQNAHFQALPFQGRGPLHAACGVYDNTKEVCVPPLPAPQDQRLRHMVPTLAERGGWQGPWPTCPSRPTAMDRENGGGAESHKCGTTWVIALFMLFPERDVRAGPV